MDWEQVAPILLAMLALLLVLAGIEDARRRTIGHATTIAIAALAPLFWVAIGLSPWPGMVLQLALAMALLMVFCVPYSFGWMAGGDVKLIAALALWLPAGLAMWMLVLMSVAGGVVTLPFAIRRRLAGGADADAAPVEIPYGVAIAMAGLMVLREPIINQFG